MSRVFRKHYFILIPVMVLAFMFVSRSFATDRTSEVSYISVRIEEGDTLNSIYTRAGRDSGFSRAAFIDAVTEVNDLSDPDTIHADRYLLIPVMH